jgi:hypothetical protein
MHYSKDGAAAGVVKNNSNTNNTVEFFIYLCAELNNWWPITGSTSIQVATAIKQTQGQNKRKTN